MSELTTTKPLSVTDYDKLSESEQKEYDASRKAQEEAEQAGE
jgi:hypothetical protein